MHSDRRALIVGIQDYKILDFLKYACDDASVIYKELRDYNCRFSCTLLSNEEASARDIRNHFKNLFIGADDDATIVFFYAGHAVTLDRGTFLVTLESEDDLESGVHFARLMEIVNSQRKPRQNCVFLLDCCHAGSMAVENLSVNLESIQEAITFTQGVGLIAAVDGNANAKENDELRQGVFTHWLFLGLSGYAANSEGRVTISSLYDFVSKAMEEYSSTQKPVLKTNILGTGPILGQGHKPQQEINPSRLSESRLQEILNIVRSQIQQVRRNIEVDRETWCKRVYKETSLLLSSLIDWSMDLRRSHPELSHKQVFLQYENEILKFQNEFGNPSDGTVMPGGEIVRKLGWGGFGTVYVVKTAFGLQAYKLYHPDQLREKLKVKAFIRGYNAMKKLSHPNIVKVTHDTKAPVGFYMQFVDGVNFRDWWYDDTVKLIHVLHIIAQVLA